jgi:hypothetical protein
MKKKLCLIFNKWLNNWCPHNDSSSCYFGHCPSFLVFWNPAFWKLDLFQVKGRGKVLLIWACNKYLGHWSHQATVRKRNKRNLTGILYLCSIYEYNKMSRCRPVPKARANVTRRAAPRPSVSSCATGILGLTKRNLTSVKVKTASYSTGT